MARYIGMTQRRPWPIVLSIGSMIFLSAHLEVVHADVLHDVLSPEAARSIKDYQDTKTVVDLKAWADKAKEAQEKGTAIPLPPTQGSGAGDIQGELERYEKILHGMAVPPLPGIPDPKLWGTSDVALNKLKAQIAENATHLAELKSMLKYARDLKITAEVVKEISRSMQKNFAFLASHGLDVFERFGLDYMDMETIGKQADLVRDEGRATEATLQKAVDDRSQQVATWDKMVDAWVFNVTTYRKEIEKAIADGNQKLLGDGKAARGTTDLDIHGLPRVHGGGGVGGGGTIRVIPNGDGSFDVVIAPGQDVTLWTIEADVNVTNVSPSHEFVVAPGETVALIASFSDRNSVVRVDPIWTDGRTSTQPILFHGKCDAGTTYQFWTNAEHDAASLWITAGLTMNDDASDQLDEKRLLQRSSRHDVTGATVIGWGYKPAPPGPAATGEVPHDAVFIAARISTPADTPTDLLMEQREKAEIITDNPYNTGVVFLQATDLKVSLAGNPLIDLNLDATASHDFFHISTDPTTMQFANGDTGQAPARITGNWLNPGLFVGILGNGPTQRAAVVYSVKQGCSGK
jgi:hypothetical protein